MSFAQLCADAYARALTRAHPYVPSMAQLEESVQQVVDSLEQRPDAQDFIRASFAPSGLMPMALVMFKRARLAAPPRG